MALVTVKNKYQVVIPRSLRMELGIETGDILEAKVERGKLTYTRKTVIDRLPAGKAARARLLKQLQQEAPEWLKSIWAASKDAGLDQMTTREIDAEIAAARRERAAKRHRPQPGR